MRHANKKLKINTIDPFNPSFNEGDPVLTYDHKHDKLGAGKLDSMWCAPYTISCVLEKGAYE